MTLFVSSNSWSITLAYKDVRIYVSNNGSCLYTKNGVWHNERGPAVIGSNGYKAWYLNGIFQKDCHK